MIAAVKSVSGAAELGGSLPSTPGAAKFGDILESAVKAVDATQHVADAQLEGLASGRNIDLHGTMIALEEANIALRGMTSVRDKLVDAYQALWNMPI
jgi:flagellar hook-basal body complex protein FliE